MDKLKWIADLPANRLVMAAGCALIVLGAATEVYEVAIEQEYRFFLVIFGAVLVVISIGMAMWKSHAEAKAEEVRRKEERKAEERRRRDDKEMRQSLLDAGKKPEDDETVYGRVKPEVKPSKGKPKKK